jgi:hypothetical protein
MRSTHRLGVKDDLDFEEEVTEAWLEKHDPNRVAARTLRFSPILAAVSPATFLWLLSPPNPQETRLFRLSVLQPKALLVDGGLAHNDMNLVYGSRWGWSVLLLLFCCGTVGGVWLRIAASNNDWKEIVKSVNHNAIVLLSALTSALTCLILFFAALYWSMSTFNANSFGRTLTKGDSVTVAIGILSTNGPGGAYARTPATRAASDFQMVADIVLFLVVLTVVIGRFSSSEPTRTLGPRPRPGPGPRPSPPGIEHQLRDLQRAFGIDDLDDRSQDEGGLGDRPRQKGAARRFLLRKWRSETLQ